jgi:lysophospholipase L1-like esterase
MKHLRILCLFLLLSVASLNASDTLRVACVGNSITYGHGIANRSTDSYPAVLQQLMGKGYQVKNYGFSGRTCLLKGDYPYMKETMYREALEWHPDIVIIKLGTNDSKPYNWKYQADFPKDLNRMVRSFKKLPSKPRVYLCYPAKVYKPAWNISDSVIHYGVIPYVKRVARANRLTVIDLYSATSNRPDLFPDGVHPNEAGAKVIAETVAKVLQKAH